VTGLSFQLRYLIIDFLYVVYISMVCSMQVKKLLISNQTGVAPQSHSSAGRVYIVNKMFTLVWCSFDGAGIHYAKDSREGAVA
jgi:hypothetical protein